MKTTTSNMLICNTLKAPTFEVNRSKSKYVWKFSPDRYVQISVKYFEYVWKCTPDRYVQISVQYFEETEKAAAEDHLGSIGWLNKLQKLLGEDLQRNFIFYIFYIIFYWSFAEASRWRFAEKEPKATEMHFPLFSSTVRLICTPTLL